jgi:hypothetical protein
LLRDAYGFGDLFLRVARQPFLSKGQQAMATAMRYPEGEQRGRGKKSTGRKLAETSNF